MNHLEIIQKAYNQVGIVYVVRLQTSSIDGSEYAYLFLTNERERSALEQEDLDRLLRTRRFMEFRDGTLASY